jgi:hypothetical protein
MIIRMPMAILGPCLPPRTDPESPALDRREIGLAFRIWLTDPRYGAAS